MESCFDQHEKKLNEPIEMRGTDQRVASLEPDARQPRLAMVADRQASTKTRERPEGAATAVHAMHGDSCLKKNQSTPRPSKLFCHPG